MTRICFRNVFFNSSWAPEIHTTALSTRTLTLQGISPRLYDNNGFIIVHNVILSNTNISILENFLWKLGDYTVKIVPSAGQDDGQLLYSSESSPSETEKEKV